MNKACFSGFGMVCGMDVLGSFDRKFQQGAIALPPYLFRVSWLHVPLAGVLQNSLDCPMVL